MLYPLGAALVALTVGGVQAWLAERTDANLRQILYVAAIISLGIPYVLYIVAWLLLLGKAGPVNAILQHLLGGAGPYINVYSLGGMIFIEGMLWSPLAFLLLSPVFRNSDASFEEAASISGAGVFSTLRHITIGMVRPALLALGLLVFIKASEAFEVPALVGLPGSRRVLDQHDLSDADAATFRPTSAAPPRSGCCCLSSWRSCCTSTIAWRRGPSLSNRHRKGFPAARGSPRPLALRRGRADRGHTAYRHRSPAGDDPVGRAAAVLSAVQHRGAAQARRRQLRRRY